VVRYSDWMACYALILEVARNHPALVGTAVVLLSGLVGHFPVVWFLKLTNFLRPTEAGKPNFGRWIGVFERFAITLFVFLDSLGAAAFIFGLKTAVMSWRVDKEEANKKDIVEYILLGTFVSFLVAVAFGLIGRGLLGLPIVKEKP
jgi:hypothetical protein